MADTATITSTREPGRIRSLLGTRVGRPLSLLVGLAAATTLWVFSEPGGPSMEAFIILMFGWCALGVYWTIRLLAALFAGGSKSVLSQWLWWATPVAVVIVTAALLVPSIPLLARFNLSQGAMDEFARDVVARRITDVPERVGLFRVTRMNRFEGGMRFLVNEGFVDPAGFAYSPDERPPNIGGEDRYYHLEGPWYLWEESW